MRVHAPWSPDGPCRHYHVTSDSPNPSSATPAPRFPTDDGCPESTRPRTTTLRGRGLDVFRTASYTPHLGGRLQARPCARPRRGDCTRATSRSVRPSVCWGDRRGALQEPGPCAWGAHGGSPGPKEGVGVSFVYVKAAASCRGPTYAPCASLPSRGALGLGMPTRGLSPWEGSHCPTPSPGEAVLAAGQASPPACVSHPPAPGPVPAWTHPGGGDQEQGHGSYAQIWAWAPSCQARDCGSFWPRSVPQFPHLPR